MTFATSTSLLDWLTLLATLVVIGCGVIAIVAPATAAAIVRAHRPVAIGVVVLWGVPLARWILVGALTGTLRAAAMTTFNVVRAAYGFTLGYALTAAIAGVAHFGHGRDRLLLELAGGFAGLLAFRTLLRGTDGLRLYPKRPARPLRAFSLWLGTSTGALTEHGHTAGIAPQREVALSVTDAAQNVVILGAIGSGKTTRAVNPLLVQLLAQDCGGLVFDIKGDFGGTVAALASEAGRAVRTIGPGHERMNLLDGLTPEVAASFLKSAFLLSAGRGDRFWVDTAAELCRNALGVLRYLPGRYALDGLYRYLFEPKTREAWDCEVTDTLLSLSLDARDRDERLLRSYLAYHEDVFAHFEPKVQSNINAQVAQVLSPFNHPDLVDAFCVESGTQARMEAVLDGTVYLVALPLALYGLGAKAAYTFIKLRFFNLMQRRRLEKTWNQSRPVFFLCDEYQEIVSCAKDGVSDLNFWDKSRSSGCIGVISAQGVSSFYAAIGDRDLADTVLQNFRQTICFRTEDRATIERMNFLLGAVDVARISENVGSSTTTGHGGSSSSAGYGLSLQRQNVITPQLFRQLRQNDALALLSIGGNAYDDVLTMPPVFT